MKIISIDYDYFFKEDPLHDWAHGETQFLINDIWETRAAGFMAAGEPLPGLTGNPGTFWKRIPAARPPKLMYVAESHNAKAPQRRRS